MVYCTHQLADLLNRVNKKQLLLAPCSAPPTSLGTYLRLAKKPLGLLINFNEPLLKNGITRIINAPEGAEDLT